MDCEWTPPKRRKLVQKLRPTGYNAVVRAVEQAKPEQLEVIRKRIDQMLEGKELAEEEHQALIAQIAARS
jgi:hydrogenase maturation factor HypE